jgi:nucleoporin NDC1
LFAEVYVWARPVDDGFGVINHGRAHERARLNERAIAFRTLFVLLGIVQSFAHLFSDRDKVPSPTRKVKVDPKAAPSINTVDSPVNVLRAAVPPIITRLAWTAVLFPVGGFFLYIITPLRSIAWCISFDTLRFLYLLPVKQRNHYTGFSPIVPFFWAVLSETALLVLLWEFTNAAFSAYISQPPLRRDEPLTSDDKKAKAKDPNGSLITGLKSKKEFARSSAFYELLLITIRFPDRRKSIYSELDRVGGNSWSQISRLCLAQIQGITTRIDGFNTAANPTPPPSAEIKTRALIAPPLKTDNVFADQPLPMGTPARTGEWAKSVAARYGNSPGAEPAKDFVKYAGRKLLTDRQREALAQQPQAVEKRAEGLLDAVVRSFAGWPFRHSFDRKVTGIICGTPYSQAGIIADATDSLTRLVVESLKEDVYGQVSGDVVSIIRVYMSTLKAIQGFLQTMKPHWTDVEFSEARRSQAKEVNDVVGALRDGLGAMLGAFGEYLPTMGLSGSEVREIKTLVAEGQKKSEVAREDGNQKEKKEKRKDRRREMEQVQ